MSSNFDLIPKGVIAPMRMTVKPGGYDDQSQGWTGGYSTQSFDTGAVFLSAEFVITGGEYAKRKLWSNIGLYSPKGPTWCQMGRSFIRAALNSARNVHPQDNSPQAAAARRIQGFHELDGLEFLARVDIEKDSKGQDRNVVKVAVEPDHPDYAKLMGVPPKSPGGGTSCAPAQAAPAYQAPAPQRAPVTGNKTERLSVSSNGLSKSYITIRRNPRKGEIVLVVPTSDSDGACLAQVWRVNKRTKSIVVRLLSYEDRLGMCSSNIEIGYGWCTPANYLHHKDLEQK